MGDGEREAEIGRSLKSKRVQESRDRESTEGWAKWVNCMVIGNQKSADL